jgi:hypothetical protein
MQVVNKTLVTKVINAFAKESVALAKVRDEQDKAIQAVLDAMLIACDKPKAEFMKGNAKSNPARAQVKEMFDAIVSENCSAKSAAQYQTAFWIAFEQGVPFQRNLVNKKAEAKAAKPKTGKVESTDRKALDATLSKAIHQARLLGLTEFAAELVDLCIESLDDFKETSGE